MSKDVAAIQIPRGLADPEGKFAYVSGLQGFIYRLDLESGEIQARTNFPGLPLALYADSLIGWTPTQDSNNVRLFFIVKQQNVLHPAWEHTLALPAWAEVRSPEAESFLIQADFQGEQLLITWKARSRYSGGAPPPPEIEAAETRAASEVVHMDPQTGAVLREETIDLIPGTVQPFPELAENWHIVPYLRGEAWTTQPWFVDLQEAFLVRRNGEPGIWLVRRASGSATEPIVTRLTDHSSAEAAITPNGELVFVHENGSDSPAWMIYAVKTGQKISSVPFEAGTQGVSVVNHQVLYLIIQELGTRRHTSLRCWDMHTGEQMWSFTLEEASIGRAPPPPP